MVVFLSRKRLGLPPQASPGPPPLLNQAVRHKKKFLEYHRCTVNMYQKHYKGIRFPSYLGVLQHILPLVITN